jgi:leucyl aminopeptidase
VALLGLGRAKAFGPAGLVALGTRVARLGRDVSAARALLVLPRELAGAESAALVARGAAAGAYSFERYKTHEKSKKKPLGKLALYDGHGGKPARALAPSLARAAVLARAMTLARDLVNEPALGLYPETLAARARAVARESGLSVKVLGPAELERAGMRLLLGVGAGSSRSPRLVHLIWKPRRGKAGAKKPLVLVGKGITFDSGGLSLKPAASMEDMKSDMAGAAAVLAAMQAIAALGAEHEVHGILALAENMPSGTAIRPGDVIQSAAGKTVEVVNTDAEGRLVLADALHYATELGAGAIIDVATLTGSCVVALGHTTAGLFANDDSLAERVLASARASGESFWRLPLIDEQRRELKSEVADLKNSGAREGSAITAAIFLSEFVGGIPWVHLDIAGPALGKGRGEPKGATGVAVPTLVGVAVP